MKIIRGILITLALIALVIAGFVHFALVKPLAERTAVEHPDDLAFVAGVLPVICPLLDLATHDDDIVAAGKMVKSIKNKGNECKSSISAFAFCAVELSGGILDSDARKQALQQAKTAKRAYDAVHQMLVKAKKIARDLPAYDDNTRAVKAALVKVITHFEQMDILDFLHLDEEEQNAWAETALTPYGDQFEAWIQEVDGRYDDFGALVGLMYGAHQIHPVLSNMLMWNMNQYGLDEIMQRAPSFKLARQNGCLQGETLFDATMQLIARVENLKPKFQKLAELTATDGPNCDDGSIVCE